MLIKVRLLTTAATFTALLAEKDPVVAPDGFMPIYATEEALAVGTPVVVPWQSQGEEERLRLGVVAEQQPSRRLTLILRLSRSTPF